MDSPEILLQTRVFRVVRQSYRTPDGREHVRETVVHPGAVAIVPMVDDDHVCLIRNYRPSVGRTLIELPAGTLGQGEDPRAAAARELIEETGYRARSVEPLVEFFMSPGILNERMYVFLATGLESGVQQLEAGEQIERLVVAWDEALDMVRQGKIQDAKSLAGLLHYDLTRRRAKA